jgi:hypothetical protein
MKKTKIVKQLEDSIQTEFYREMAARLAPDLQQKISFRPEFVRLGEPTNILGAGTEVRAKIACVKKDLGNQQAVTIPLPEHWVVVEKFSPHMEKKIALQAEGASPIMGKLTRTASGYSWEASGREPVEIPLCASQRP